MTTRGDFRVDSRLLRVCVIALAIGIVASAVAWLLLSAITLFTNIFYFHSLSLVSRPPAEHGLGTVAIIIPALGGLIIGLMARYGSERIRGHGIPEALEAILFGKSIMSAKVAVLKPLSSAISIGSGGPFGAEGPIIMTGGAFGSLLAQAFHLTATERKTLLVAGAAAGMSAIFASPIAAVFLAIELLLFEWRPRSLIPVALASMVAAGLRAYILGDGPLFPIPAHAILPSSVLLQAIVVGLIAGAFSSVLSIALYRLEDAFSHLKCHWMWWPAIGGIAVGIGGYFQPRALGVGYDVIADLLNGRLSWTSVSSLVLAKGLMWIVALASGTSGGVLAPLLIMGCGLGVIESHFMPNQGAMLWPLVSMAAVLGGMMRSPFTAVIFALELSHDVNALPPLLAASISAYGFSVVMMKRSILTEKVARRGHDIFREYSVDPLERMQIGEIMTKDVVTIPERCPLDEIRRRYFSHGHKHRGYPVVSSSGELVSVLTVNDVLAFDTQGSDTDNSPAFSARSVLTARPQESCRLGAERMAIHSVGRLIVVDVNDPTKILGIVTRSDLLKARYKDHQEENLTERPLFSCEL